MEDVETAARLGLNARQVKGMEYMKLHGKIKSSIYASINSVSVPSSIKDMKKLEKLGLVKKVGKYRGAYYVLNKEK
jgi:ATP-dependent DNA helicase RecG